MRNPPTPPDTHSTSRTFPLPEGGTVKVTVSSPQPFEDCLILNEKVAVEAAKVLRDIGRATRPKD